MAIQTGPVPFVSGVFKVPHSSGEVRSLGRCLVRASLGTELPKAFRTACGEESHGQEACRFPGDTYGPSGFFLVQTKGRWITETVL